MALAVPQYLVVGDLEEIIGAAEVDRLFDDDGDGLRETPKVNAVLAMAESLALSRMLRGWSQEQVVDLAAEDPNFVTQVAWVAAELATERRPAFQGTDGWGRYRAMYERAIDYFDALSKSKIHSKGESAVGKNAQSGGNLVPRTSDGKALQPVFSPSKDRPLGQGGF
jgi:hypothetical protein